MKAYHSLLYFSQRARFFGFFLSSSPTPPSPTRLYHSLTSFSPPQSRELLLFPSLSSHPRSRTLILFRNPATWSVRARTRSHPKQGPSPIRELLYHFLLPKHIIALRMCQWSCPRFYFQSISLGEKSSSRQRAALSNWAPVSKHRYACIRVPFVLFSK